MARHVRPADTSYRHQGSSVTWEGVGGATRYECHTDCSGFLNALLRRGYGLTGASFEGWLGTRRPLARTYHEAIVEQNGFRRIRHLQEVKPGDIIAIRYAPHDPENKGHDTGHVMLVVSKPRVRGPSRPHVRGTQQWEVEVVDASRSGHGRGDTRRNWGGQDAPGLGQGVFRIYTGPDGAVAGHTWSTLKGSRYRGQRRRHLVIGRLQLRE
jgi:hypothetical protein